MQPRNMSMSGVVDLAAVKAAGEAKAKAEQARAQRQDGAGAGRLARRHRRRRGALRERRPAALRRGPGRHRLLGRLVRAVQAAQPAAGAARRRVRRALLLATTDVYANQMLFQQFGVQGIPAVFAVVAGPGACRSSRALAPEDQIRQALDQLVAVAEQRFGIVGAEVLPGRPTRPPRSPPRPATPQEPALAAAHEALDAGDLGGAVQAYKNVLADDPANAEAKLGLAQAELLGRVQGPDHAAGARGGRRAARGRRGPAAPPPTSTSSAVTSRTPSAVWWRPCGGRRVTTGRPRGCDCWSCSR